MTPTQFVDLISQNKVKAVDLRFMDFPGAWQRITLDSGAFLRNDLRDGVGFDGSCVRGWEKINEADMVLSPCLETAVIDPFFDRPTVGIICDVKNPMVRKKYSRDPRSVARRAEDYLKQTEIADEARFAPEVEFFVFDQVRYQSGVHQSFYEVNSQEGAWSTGNQDENKGRQIGIGAGRYPTSPQDTLLGLREQMMLTLQRMNVPAVMHAHEVSTGGQCEIYLEDQTLLQMADNIATFRYVVKNEAARSGKVATFMPKPLFGDNGSGMHCHFSLFKEGESIIAGKRYGGLSQTGLYAIGGILKHGRALAAFTNPTTNSYKRLVVGYEAPVHLVYSSRNRWSAIRIPVYSFSEDSRRLEIRFPDSSCNPYLAFSAIMMAALDGIENKIHPGDPIDLDIDQRTPKKDVEGLPTSLSSALDALQNDHEFLLRGNVFDQDLINYWIEYKQLYEVNALFERPHPHEFELYFNV